MDEQGYSYSFNRVTFEYEFFSISSVKKVRKVVVFSEMEKDVYNLALLDEIEDGFLSDMSESNNDDLVTVMATVIKIVDDFLTKNPHFFVVFSGSDERRQRLYRIIITKELEKIKQKFEIFSVNKNGIIPFQANQEYEFILIKKI